MEKHTKGVTAKKTKPTRDTQLVRHKIYVSQASPSREEVEEKEKERKGKSKRKLDIQKAAKSDVFDIGKEDILSASATDAYEVRPLEDWMSQWFNPQGLTATDLQHAALQEMNNCILKSNEILHHPHLKKEGGDSSEKSSFKKVKKRKPNEVAIEDEDVNNNNNNDSSQREGTDVAHLLSSSTTKIQGKPPPISSKDPIDKDEAMRAFYQNDFDDQAYGLNPNDYTMFSLVLELDHNKDAVLNRLFRDQARDWYKQSNRPMNHNFIETPPDVYTYEDLPGVTKTYCSEFFRTPTSKERSCVNECLCVGNILIGLYPKTHEHTLVNEGNPCILKEFLLPRELEVWKKTGSFPSYRKMCIICNRFSTMQKYLKNQEKHHNAEDIIQDHYLIISEEDGYKKDGCLPPIVGGKWLGIVGPFYPYLPNTYVIQKKNIGGTGNKKTYEYSITERDVDFQSALTQAPENSSFL